MSRPKVVLLGMMSKIPVGGVIWLVAQYAEGFRRLGFDPYYVEAHGRVPSMFMEHEHDDATGKAADFIARQMRRFDMNDRWAFHALHDDGACYGLSEPALSKLYRDAALIINLHGSTLTRPEHSATGRLVYMGTDPVELELELHRGEQAAVDFLEPHSAFFTWGLNYGNPDCRLPWSDRFRFVPSPPPVVIDFWENGASRAADSFTTVGNWRQPWRNVTFEGEIYHWSKHLEFEKVLDLPSRTGQNFELALSSLDEADRSLLQARGWRLTDALAISSDPDPYRDFIVGSRAEFTVAKDQNVRLRTGWFSERSATYLAAGRPVVMQDTGFSNAIPTGVGLLEFSDVDQAAAAVDEVNGDYDRHCRAARDIALECFSYDIVLGDLLDHVGLEAPIRPRHALRSAGPVLPSTLVLVPDSRRPLLLPSDTVERVLARPVPRVVTRSANSPRASVVVATFNNLVVTRMALESVLASTERPAYELIVVDNGSSDGTADYLSVLAARNDNVRVVLNDHNRGFAAACNQALAGASGDVLVVLNNDTIVTEGWLEALIAHLQDSTVGLLGPVTGRCGNAAEVATNYATYGELLSFARDRAVSCRGMTTELPMAVMFCTAMRRDVFERVGVLDETFELGLFEDDDYSMRVRAAGYRILCAEDVFVHHFGEASLGALPEEMPYGRLFEVNKRRFEAKWNTSWTPHPKRVDERYQALTVDVRDLVSRCTAPGDVVAVISKGDDAMVQLADRHGWHFPRAVDGRFAGHYPADGADAIAQFESARAAGVGFFVIPQPSLWWLTHYAELATHLDSRYRRVEDDSSVAVLYDVRTESMPSDAAALVTVSPLDGDEVIADVAAEGALLPSTKVPNRDVVFPISRSKMTTTSDTSISGVVTDGHLIPSQAICVLGMHRSGTSLITGLLNILGVDLGPPEHMMKWVAGNPRGHWEHNGLLEINKEILSRLGGSWHELPVFPQGWEQSPAFADLRRRARDVLIEDFGSSSLWGWKDPRTCLTLPFWQLLVGDMRYVLCIRNPIDVGRSLSVRPKESLDERRSSELWLRYVHAALRHSNGHERMVIFYEDLMEDWQSEVMRMNSFLGIGERLTHDTSREVREFLEGELWHHRASVADVLDDSDLSMPVKATYLALRLSGSTDGLAAGARPLELVSMLTEYALETQYALTEVVDDSRRRAEAAEREASEAWTLLRDHRAALVKLISPEPSKAEAPSRSAYDKLVKGIRERAVRFLPQKARVLVVSKGDPELLALPGLDAWHFPRNNLGQYAGFHPASGQEVIAHLGELRAKGANFMLFPRPYAWWLKHYDGLADYLADNARLLDDSDAGLIYEFMSGSGV